MISPTSAQPATQNPVPSAPPYWKFLDLWDYTNDSHPPSAAALFIADGPKADTPQFATIEDAVAAARLLSDKSAPAVAIVQYPSDGFALYGTGIGPQDVRAGASESVRQLHLPQVNGSVFEFPWLPVGNVTDAESIVAVHPDYSPEGTLVGLVDAPVAFHTSTLHTKPEGSGGGIAQIQRFHIGEPTATTIPTNES